MHLAVFFIDVRLCVDTDIESYISALIYKIARWKPRWLVGNKNIYIYLYIYIYVTLSLNRARRKSMEPSKAYCGWKHMTMVIPQYNMHIYIHTYMYAYIHILIYICVYITHTHQRTARAQAVLDTERHRILAQHRANILQVYIYTYTSIYICSWWYAYEYTYIYIRICIDRYMNTLTCTYEH